MAGMAKLTVFTTVVVCLMSSVTECETTLKPAGDTSRQGTRSTGGHKATVSAHGGAASKTDTLATSGKLTTYVAAATTNTNVSSRARSTPSRNGITTNVGGVSTTTGAKVNGNGTMLSTKDSTTTNVVVSTTAANVSGKTNIRSSTGVGVKTTDTKVPDTTSKMTTQPTPVDVQQNQTLSTVKYVNFGTMTATSNVHLWPMLIINVLYSLVSINTTADQKPLRDLLTDVRTYNNTALLNFEQILEDIFVPENGTRDEKLLKIMENMRNSTYVQAIWSALKPFFTNFDVESPQTYALLLPILAGNATMNTFRNVLDMMLASTGGSTGGNGQSGHQGSGNPATHPVTQPTAQSGGNSGFSDLSGIFSIVNMFKNNGTGFKQLMQMLPWILEMPLQKFNVSKECHQDIYTMLNGIGAQEKWALRMLDAFGKPSAELMNFQMKWIGSYDECVALKGMPWAAGAARHFDGRYCAAAIPITAIELPPAAKMLSDGDNPVIMPGTCVPNTCSDDDVIGIIKAVASMLGANETYTPGAECKVEKSVGDDGGAIAVICVLSILGACMVIGTAYDVIVVQLKAVTVGKSGNNYTLSDPINAYEMKDGVVNVAYVKAEEAAEVGHEKTITHNGTGQSMGRSVADTATGGSRSLLEQILLSFSIYTNGVKILNTSQASGSLGSVNGIRFLSMAWVIFGHTYFFTGGYDDNLIVHVFTKMNDWTFMALPFATVSVDSFFTLSGLLVGYLTLRELKKLGGARKLNWGMYYFHRFWRLTPPYMLVLMVATVLVPYFTIGPLWPMGDGQWVATCRKYWWTNLLYINNLVKVDKMCLAWSWYLSNDMQFYVLSPLLLLPLFYHMAAGIASCAIFLGTTIVCTAYLVHKGNYSPQIINPWAYQANDDNWNRYVYIPSYTRMGPYVVGMFTGYLLYKWKCRCRMPKVLVLAGWTVCLFITTSIVYGLYSDGDKHIVAPPAGTAYQVLIRPGWGIAISWIIFACATGNGGWINQVLSWKPFVPLGRLSYLAYLIHPLVMVVFYRSRRIYTHFTDYEVTYLFIGHLVITYGASFVLSLAFEAPWMGLEKALFKRVRRS